MKEFHSDISGFYKLSLEKRQKKIGQLFNLDQEEIKTLQNLGYFQPNQIDTLIENVIGSYQLPLGLAFNFKINGKDYFIPMVIEEPSVVAAASNAAKFARNLNNISSKSRVHIHPAVDGLICMQYRCMRLAERTGDIGKGGAGHSAT